ncbi:MAG TPA: ribbon-helix-helix domain-containing protein [Polyangiaceae bacterium]
MSRKKISTTIYVTPEQSDKLRLLHDRTKVPVAVYIREGIDLVLQHYAHLLPGQLQLDAPARRAPRENGSTRSLEHAARLAAEKEKDKSEKHVAEKDRDSESDAGASTSHSKKRDAAGA